MVCDPSFDYGRAKHRVEVLSPEEVRLVPDSCAHGLDSVRLRAQTPLQVKEDGSIVSDFALKAGERAFFILDGHEDSPHGIDVDREGALFKETLNFWQTWVAQSTYRGRWREVVDRSALVLKLLTSERHGSIVAAATFGLPETMGGERNWDYRYTWIRDASFTLYALIRLGFVNESKAFNKWLEDRCRELGPNEVLQIMFAVDGRRHLPETILSHWEGHRKSSPVRIGNGAAEQLQLDIYGELLDSIYLYDKYGEPISHELWSDLSRLLEWVCQNWDRPDEGIWEVRGGTQHLFYSRLMCWVAVDRGLRLAAKRSFPAPVQRWASTRDAIYQQMHTEFWNEKMKSFVQTKGGNTVDASSLLAPLVRFISPTDPRWLSTQAAIERDLLDDSLVYRYRSDDGLTGNEGTFGICSFWFIECLARSGDVKRARFLFEKMLGYANHLGLYGEELGPSGEHLGNFPQAFTHLALISAAYAVDRKLDRR
jgi:GH15 family glucan-1,4-alpha-glucosidase